MHLSVVTYIFASCLFWASQNNPKIEIYLLKKRVPPIENKNWPALAVRHFLATKDAIQDSAFILDTEIIGYDSTRKNIRITTSAASKISRLEPDIPKGIQFVLTIDKEPILSGYFINKNTSEPTISYMNINKNDTFCHIDRLLPGIEVDERKGQKLIDAFKLTKRLQ